MKSTLRSFFSGVWRKATEATRNGWSGVRSAAEESRQHPILVITGTVGFVAAVLGIYVFFFRAVPDDPTEIPPAEYAERLNLIACEFEESSREAAADVERAREDFLLEPLEHARTYIGEVARFSDGENPRLERALAGLDELSDDGPPEKFRADHENYGAVLGAHKVAVSLIDEKVPDNAAELSDLELLEIIGPDFHEIWRRVLAAQAAVSQGEYTEEFKEIKSCEVAPGSSSVSIVAPTDGAQVSSNVLLRGTARGLEDLNLYVFVHPIPSDPNQLWDLKHSPAVDENGLWEADLSLAVDGIPYDICVVLTDETLESGRLFEELPRALARDCLMVSR